MNVMRTCAAHRTIYMLDHVQCIAVVISATIEGVLDAGKILHRLCSEEGISERPIPTIILRDRQHEIVCTFGFSPSVVVVFFIPSWQQDT